jgi:hypothetical protein
MRAFSRWEAADKRSFSAPRNGYFCDLRTTTRTWTPVTVPAQFRRLPIAGGGSRRSAPAIDQAFLGTANGDVFSIPPNAVVAG